MPNTQYSINLDNNWNGAITVIEGSNIRTWRSDDPNFNHIFAAVKRGLSLAEIEAFRIPVDLTRFSERVAMDGETLLFDGRPMDGPIEDAFLRYLDEGREPTNLVKFLELLSENVTPRSRDELFKWLESQQLEIDPEGFVIGYRGLKDDMYSVHSGGAFVLTKEERDRGVTEPGTWVDGHVPNFVGSIISMPRDQVDDNSSVDCSHGLHVGSESYARTWGDPQTTICVRFNPADVVSVPHYDTNKMRVCRYEVLSMHGVDNEPERGETFHPDLPTPEETDAVLAQVVPEEFRRKQTKTGNFITRRFRRKQEDEG